jgi:hypothetical protein
MYTHIRNFHSLPIVFVIKRYILFLYCALVRLSLHNEKVRWYVSHVILGSGNIIEMKSDGTYRSVLTGKIQIRLLTI